MERAGHEMHSKLDVFCIQKSYTSRGGDIYVVFYINFPFIRSKWTSVS